MDFHLKPVGKQCTATGRELAPGSTCYSALIERNGEMHRIDFSTEGWSGPPEGALGYWKCVVPEPVSARARTFNPDTLMQYFEQLTDDALPGREKFRYVLALLLLQKRRLRVEGSRRDGDVEYLQLSGSHGEGPYEVRDHQLTADEIGSLEAELNTHLANEWSGT
jgi:hypothetical protein